MESCGCGKPARCSVSGTKIPNVGSHIVSQWIMTINPCTSWLYIYTNQMAVHGSGYYYSNASCKGELMYYIDYKHPKWVNTGGCWCRYCSLKHSGSWASKPMYGTSCWFLEGTLWWVSIEKARACTVHSVCNFTDCLQWWYVQQSEMTMWGSVADKPKSAVHGEVEFRLINEILYQTHQVSRSVIIRVYKVPLRLYLRHGGDPTLPDPVAVDNGKSHSYGCNQEIHAICLRPSMAK